MATGKAAANPRISLRNLFLCSGFFSSMCLQVLVLLVLSGIAASQTIVTELPGYDGDLPFTLETGYVGVGDSNETQLFYYLVESQRSPSEDPLMLWLTGGPGGSGSGSLTTLEGFSSSLLRAFCWVVRH